MHITASVYINDDEPGLIHDYDAWLEKLAPFGTQLCALAGGAMTAAGLALALCAALS
jgi:thiamine phosphate synthase YjbQ (UPF0047 family)